MLSGEQVRRLLGDLASDRIERTATAANADEIAQAITACANDLAGSGKPGYILVGARYDGSLCGLPVSDNLLEQLNCLAAGGGIQPLPAITVYKRSFDSGDVAVVEVRPSDVTPVRYKGQVWVRFGSQRVIASEQEERVLAVRRLSATLTFDAQPCREARLSDLAVNRLRYPPQAVSPDHRDIRFQLASRRFYDLRLDCPTYAGLLLLGTKPRLWLPGAYVQFVNRDDLELDGDLLTVLRRLNDFVELNYPAAALRELLMNAVMHRDYRATAPVRFFWFSDSIEITSPGGLYGEASPENFPNQTNYRNPVIAEAMKSLGYVNRFGSGVLRAQALLERNGNPPPEFSFDSGYVRVKVRARP